jgi:subfamily B ATP-binding cassette protein HlyB/CyaB
MKINIGTPKSPLHSGETNEASIQDAFSKLLTAAQIAEDENFPNLAQLDIQSFRLGDEILSSLDDASCSKSSNNGAESSVHHKHNPSDFYIVCQGRVRLLCWDAEQQRNVTATLLEVGETFGADEFLNETLLPYRAVAASPVQVARLSVDVFLPLLEKLPALQQYLAHQSQLRERLIFFKTYTNLRTLSSHQLQYFIPDLVEERIPSGTFVTESLPKEVNRDAEHDLTRSTDRLWLRQGDLSCATQPIAIGESWGYPDDPPTDWTAHSELRVYKLAAQRWEMVQAMLPTSDALQNSGGGDIHSSSNQSNTAARSRSRGQVIYQSASPQRHQAKPLQLVSEPPTRTLSKNESIAIVFPKPVRRHLMDAFSRYPWIEQQSSSDCGAACLAMITRYWGKQIPIYVLREHANVGRAGATLKSLAKASELLGFQARPVRASLNRMAEQPNPWIAHWDGSHYVVVYKVTNQRVMIGDPAVGRQSLSREEFQNHWTGYGLLLDPTTQLQNVEVKQTSLTRYLGALLPHQSIIWQILVFSILIQLFGLVTPLFTQIILDRVVVQRSLNTLNVFAIGLLLFGLWSIGLTAVRQYLLSYFSNRLDLTLISGFINHTLKLPLKFFESRRVGDIITRVQENQKIQRFLIQRVVLAWLGVVTGFVYLGLMFYYNWQLTLLILLLIPPIVLLTLGATPFLRHISRQIFKEVADQNSVLVEMITGIATVKSAAAEQELRWRWEDHLTRQLNTQFKGQKFSIGLESASGLINTLGGTLLLWYGATLVIQEQLTIGQFVAFNMMLGYVISPVVELANLWDELQEVLISVERLNDVFEAKPEEVPQEALLVLPTVAGKVEFEDVTFRYDEDSDQNTLQNISFRVEPGQTIAIVGRSGSGKSTLVKLIEGLYHPTQGRVSIDDHDLRHVSPQSLRSQMGVVPQECFLFSGTIAENIALYRTDYTLEEVIEVAKLAEAHSFIQAMPLGYNTKVGERGSSLSGGQRQRIAIARALLGVPRILILDEATSSLDTESERRFQNNLTQISRDRTTFIIAHRLSTVHNADRILVIDRGVLVEQGNHQELMNRRGLYYHLAQQQLNL